MIVTATTWRNYALVFYLPCFFGWKFCIEFTVSHLKSWFFSPLAVFNIFSWILVFSSCYGMLVCFLGFPFFVCWGEGGMYFLDLRLDISPQFGEILLKYLICLSSSSFWDSNHTVLDSSTIFHMFLISFFTIFSFCCHAKLCVFWGRSFRSLIIPWAVSFLPLNSLTS